MKSDRPNVLLFVLNGLKTDFSHFLLDKTVLVIQGLSTMYQASLRNYSNMLERFLDAIT